MPIRRLFLALLVLSALAIPAMSGAKSTYTDPFSPTSQCRAHHLSKHHARGTKRSPYSVCVKALKQMQKHHRLSARKACKGESRRHARHKKSSYARCVAAGRGLRGA